MLFTFELNSCWISQEELIQASSYHCHSIKRFTKFFFSSKDLEFSLVRYLAFLRMRMAGQNQLLSEALKGPTVGPLRLNTLRRGTITAFY